MMGGHHLLARPDLCRTYTLSMSLQKNALESYGQRQKAVHKLHITLHRADGIKIHSPINPMEYAGLITRAIQAMPQQEQATHQSEIAVASRESPTAMWYSSAG